MAGVLGFVAVIIIIAGIVLCVWQKASGNNDESSGKGWLAAIIGGLALFVLANSFVIVPTGYTGVRITFGQISEQTVQNGFNWKIPFVQSICKVNNKQQDISFANQVWCESKERTAVYAEGVVVTYQINSEKSAWIYANVSDYENSLVGSSLVASAIKAATKTYSDEDVTNRSYIEPSVMESLQDSLDGKYGENVVIINKVVIEDMDFEDSYKESIAEKQQAQLEAEQQEIVNQKNIDQAEAEAEAKVIAAQADADALLIAAEAEKEANELLSQSLDSAVLQYQYLEKWDGVLPSYVGGDGDLLVGIGAFSDSASDAVSDSSGD